MKKETKSFLYLLLVIAISIGIMVGFSFGIKLLENYSGFWTYFLIYFVCTIGLNILSIKFKNKFLDTLTTIFSFPLAIFLFLIQFTAPVVTIFVHSVYYLFLSTSVPFLLIQLNKYFEWREINIETETFLQLTLSIIIAITFYKAILAITFKISPFRIKSSKKMRKYKLDELIEYIFNRQNIRFAIYVSFFIYLFIYSFQILENSSLFITSLRDKAILQSFLCFLAYDRIILNSKIVALLPSQLLKRFFTSITGSEGKKQ